MMEEEQEQNRCPHCGNYLDYIEKFDAYYCKTCKDYKEVKENETAKSGVPSVVPTSSTAAQERCYICLGFIKDESEYFIHQCIIEKIVGVSIW